MSHRDVNPGRYYYYRPTRECSGPDCGALVPADFVCCQACWATVPEGLKARFYGSCCGKAGRREAWKRIERYLATRARLKELANA